MDTNVGIEEQINLLKNKKVKDKVARHLGNYIVKYNEKMFKCWPKYCLVIGPTEWNIGKNKKGKIVETHNFMVMHNYKVPEGYNQFIKGEYKRIYGRN